jgi:hypothetical protein
MTTGEIQVLACGPIEAHKQPLTSFEEDMIDNLTRATTCSLILLVRGSF